MQKKIDVMIVGAQKAGTTSLLRYLGEHPDCISHPQKEFSYFTDASEYAEGLQKAVKKYYVHQDYNKNTRIIAKNASLFTNVTGLQRLKEHNPDCLLVLILRNPVERTYSSYLMEKNYGDVGFSFNQLPELIGVHERNKSGWDYNFFIDFSLYSTHLSNLYKIFPKEQVKVILYEDFREDPAAICRSIFSDLGVDQNFKPDISRKHNVTQRTRSSVYARVLGQFLHNQNPVKKMLKVFLPGHKTYKYGDMLRELNKTAGTHDAIDHKTRQFLVDFYKPHNRELAKMLGRDLSSWDN